MSNVKNFGAIGDGEADDTEAIRHALSQGDGELDFPRGNYRISETIEILLDETGRLGIDGSNGTATVIMTGEGPAFRIIGTHGGTGDPGSSKPNIWEKQRMPTVRNIEVTATNEKVHPLKPGRTDAPLKNLEKANYYQSITGTGLSSRSS